MNSLYIRSAATASIPAVAADLEDLLPKFSNVGNIFDVIDD